jgi:hypothetical protein
MTAMYAVRFPHKVASLVLAGDPIDMDAGDRRPPPISAKGRLSSDGTKTH